MSFDWLAPYYRPLESIVAGGLLHRCRTAFLDQAASVKSALLLGEGPGRYLIEVLRTNPQVTVTCVDASGSMLKVARECLRREGLSGRRVQFVRQDWRDWTGDGGPFDLVATHFFLDCFRADQLVELVPKVAAWSAPGAFWVLSDFHEPSHGWRRVRARILLKMAYLSFRWTTSLPASRLTVPDPFLIANGFELLQRRLFNQELLHADLWRMRSTD